ncbi:MAG: succinylglutamate desuccinylase/aspartoacylase family protein [Rhizobiales bacterium]|mgnify:CR=1 FL=1|nr:succinylglutamate desuccinylase/aspartoacylase family protein [Hyphomicrobiales bacterium]
MKHESVALPKLSPGLEPRLGIWRFGAGGHGPRIYIQGGLHADEAPGTLVAHRLVGKLMALSPQDILGEITIIPVANPIGLGQRILGTLIGRFALEDGRNFNRGYPDCTADVIARLEGQLGSDERANTASLRAAFAERLSVMPAEPIPAMKTSLLREAIGADYVLDLHCDTEAVPHAYTHPASFERLSGLFRLLGLKAVLVAEASGDHPFDEAVSGPWQGVRAHFAQHPMTSGGHAATIELRGQADTGPELIERDASAILEFLQHVGAIAGEKPALPDFDLTPTPLAGCGLIPAPASGALSWHRALGVLVKHGECLAEIIDAEHGIAHPVLAECDGLLFARTNLRQVSAGAKLGKIAGTETLRAGTLLGP